MNRIRLFITIAALVIVGGSLAAFAVTANSNGDPSVPIITADEASTSTSAPEPSTTTTAVVHEPHEGTTSTTTSTTEAHEPGTTSTTEFHEPTTTVPHESTTTTEPHETTTTTEPHVTTTSTTSTTEAPRPAPPGSLHLACATPAPDGGPSSVVCEWNDPPPGTTRWVLMREQVGPSQPLWDTNDLGVRRHVDDSAEPGVSYAYRISAYDGDTFLATSNSVRLVAGGEG